MAPDHYGDGIASVLIPVLRTHGEAGPKLLHESLPGLLHTGVLSDEVPDAVRECATRSHR